VTVPVPHPPGPPVPDVSVPAAPVPGPPAPGAPVRAVLALGSNLGDRMANLQGAVDAVAGAAGISFLAVSPVYRTAPVGGPDQPDFLNAVLLVTAAVPPRVLLDVAQAAEAAARRVRRERWGPRTLDVDVIAYGSTVSDNPVLTLPHPRAHQRAFVLVPWHDVEPGAVLPAHGPVAALMAAVTAAGGEPPPRRAPGRLREPGLREPG
jgi:2-amino-4-hydroxy-6-hydroxymethyldihydropteridine diphosphokinase